MSGMKFTRGEFSKKWAEECVKTSLGDPLCHVATWSSHAATSKFHLSATSRRGFPTSRRHFSTTLSRRDVDLHVATSIGPVLCHVAT